jgi:ubiquinone/menaquinone biosynthesis C-methylase UbiE
LLIEADISAAQLSFARRRFKDVANRAWLAASAFRIPLHDRAVDGVVCVRLAHHLDSGERREALFREILRVARRFAIISFVDCRSMKNFLRALRGKPSRTAMSAAQVALIAELNRARLAACPSISLLGSRHRYALLIKQPS